MDPIVTPPQILPPSVDRRVFEAIHGLPHSPQSDRYISLVSDLGEGMGWVAAGIGVAWLGGRRGRRAGIATALASLGTTYVVQRMVKPIFRRRRIVPVRPHRVVVCRGNGAGHLLPERGPARLHAGHPGGGIESAPRPPLSQRRHRRRADRRRHRDRDRLAAQAAAIPLTRPPYSGRARPLQARLPHRSNASARLPTRPRLRRLAPYARGMVIRSDLEGMTDA